MDVGIINDEKEIEEQIEKEILYIEINNSANKIISSKEAQIHFKNDIYFTFGEEKHFNLYIFDLEKNSILPEVRYLDGFSNGSKRNSFNIFSPVTLFIGVLLIIFLYYNFGDKILGNDTIDEPENPGFMDIITGNNNDIIDPVIIPQIGDTLPTIPNPVIYEPPTSFNSGNNNINSDRDIIITPSIRDIDDLEYDNNKLISDNLINLSQIEILTLKNNTLVSENTILSSNYNLLKTKFDNLFIEKNNIFEELNKQILLNLSDNQLYLSIGKDIFTRCKDNDSNYCSDYIYDFYSVREK